MLLTKAEQCHASFMKATLPWSDIFQPFNYGNDKNLHWSYVFPLCFAERIIYDDACRYGSCIVQWRNIHSFRYHHRHEPVVQFILIVRAHVLHIGLPPHGISFCSLSDQQGHHCSVLQSSLGYFALIGVTMKLQTSGICHTTGNKIKISFYSLPHDGFKRLLDKIKSWHNTYFIFAIFIGLILYLLGLKTLLFGIILICYLKGKKEPFLVGIPQRVKVYESLLHFCCKILLDLIPCLITGSVLEIQQCRLQRKEGQ